MLEEVGGGQKTGGAGKEFLVFTLGGQEYGIEILKVQEIRSYDGQGVTRIANVPEFVRGVTNLRGTIIPIVDLRVKFGTGSAATDSQTVMIILKIAARVVGAVVDAVSDVLVLQPAQVSPAPQLGSAVSTQYITGIGTVDERMLILVDIERLMTGAEMALIEQSAA